VVYVARGAIRAVCFRDNHSTPLETLLSMVGTDEGRCLVGNSNLGSDLNDTGYGNFNQNPPYMGFPAAADLVLAPLDRATPPAAPLLLANGVEPYPL
jgi:hypothetical protein